MDVDEMDVKQIFVPETVVDRALMRYENSLIGRVVGPSPADMDIDAFRLWANDKWSQNGVVKIDAMANDFYLISFSNQEDCAKVGLGGRWFIRTYRYVLFLQKWTPGFNPIMESSNKASVWIKLPNMPLEYWEEEILKDIASSIGQFIIIDPFTISRKHLLFAKFCVYVKVGKILPSSIILSSKLGKWEQHIDFEESANVCRSCRTVGHSSSSCQNRQPQQKRKEENPSFLFQLPK